MSEPSFLLGVSGVVLLPGTMSRLKLDTLSRKDNAGLGGATGRCGRVFEDEKSVSFDILSMILMSFFVIRNPFAVAAVSFQFSFVLEVESEANDHLLAAVAVSLPAAYK